jgi:hypothetical protein
MISRRHHCSQIVDHLLALVPMPDSGHREEYGESDGRAFVGCIVPDAPFLCDRLARIVAKPSIELTVSRSFFKHCWWAMRRYICRVRICFDGIQGVMNDFASCLLGVSFESIMGRCRALNILIFPIAMAA